MPNLLSEELISLAQAASRIPPYRKRRTNPSTIFRWLTQGIKMPSGEMLRLEGIRLAGRWLTSSQALTRFLETQNAACNPVISDAPKPRTPTQRERASAQAGKELEAMGV
jgi:hypothetical protein